jgi:hypothetical protein
VSDGVPPLVAVRIPTARYYGRILTVLGQRVAINTYHPLMSRIGLATLELPQSEDLKLFNDVEVKIVPPRVERSCCQPPQVRSCPGSDKVMIPTTAFLWRAGNNSQRRCEPPQRLMCPLLPFAL